MKRKILFSLVAVMMMAGLVVGCAAPASPTPLPSPPVTTGPIKLKAVMFWPYRPENPLHKAWVDVMVEGIKQKSNGMLTVELLGGPEVVPPFDQISSLSKGVIDISLIAASYANTIIPETDALMVSERSSIEERKAGFNDWVNTLFRAQGLLFLGKVPSGGMILFSRERAITNPRTDFKGMKFSGGGTMWIPFITKLGAVLTVTPIGEAYAGLQRGVFDGTGANTTAGAAQGYGEVCKYRINHPFWTGGDSSNIMSLSTWNKLPKNLQDVIMAQQLEMENTFPSLVAGMEEYETAALIKQGCQQLTFKPEDAQWYVNTAQEAKWEEVKQKLSPDSYAKLQGFFKK